MGRQSCTRWGRRKPGGERGGRGALRRLGGEQKGDGKWKWLRRASHRKPNFYSIFRVTRPRKDLADTPVDGASDHKAEREEVGVCRRRRRERPRKEGRCPAVEGRAERRGEPKVDERKMKTAPQ